MKVVYNSLIPFKGFIAMMFYWWIFVRVEAKKRFTVYVENHETIHFRQLVGITIIALVVLGILSACNVISWWWMLSSTLAYWPVYFIFWVIELILPPYNTAYKDSPFEREAKLNQSNLRYCNGFPPLWSWVKYILFER